MQDFNIFPLSPSFKVHISRIQPPRKVNPSTFFSIEKIWEKELLRTQGKLFNGKILCADHFDGKHLYGRFVEYKLYLAQVRDPTLIHELHLKPICVCGYTLAGNEILMGKRAEHVTDYPNYLELMPAGGIDPSALNEGHVDIIKQLKIELKEEAGIEEAMIHHILPSYLIVDTHSHAYEICAKILLDPAVPKKELSHDDEHTEVLWIKQNHLSTFVHQNRPLINPLSMQLLQLFLHE
ncbi:hypothetical protein NEOC84_001464|uniref:NUDIX hydrolase n=1 Tax=Neochlamydia sp. AcF84 TaxID=2315858 RepID=UPI00140C203C|nr:hypothetical protein [Neochlamydia sp. AcF84]NGY95543.1 hypothetical protein [Neochlamydia sp. AcF84]